MRTIPLIVLLSVLMASVHAQTPVPSGENSNTESSAPPSSTDSVDPLNGTPKRAWNIVPRVMVMETFSDNVAPGQGAKKSDQITQLSPGVRIEGKTARLKMFLDYQLNEQLYAQGSRGNQTQQALNSFGTFEAVENLLFVDMSGVIAQQNISAFGVQSPGAYSVNANSTETSNFRVSPYFKGRLGGYADYEARYSRSMVRAKSSVASDTDIQEWLGRVGGDTPLAFLGWSVEANRQNYDYGVGRKTESDKWRGSLIYRVNPQLKLSVSAGRESNDFETASKQSWDTNGYGVEWNPTERTQVSASREKRFFGHGHTLSISHRLPLSAVKYTDTRDVAALPNQLSTAGLGNYYDLLYAQLASTIPDETVRAAYTSFLLNVAGIAPNTPVTVGFLSSQVSVQRQQELSYILRGARNIFTLALVRSQNDRLGTGFGAGDDFSVASSIIQQGWNVGWSHQLTELSSLNVTGSHTHTTSSANNLNPQTKQKMLSAGISTKVGAKTNASVTARRTVADSTANPYTENAVVGTVSIQF
jgi:uncharacterized protein (PEP-CTERM system associated)